MLHMSRHSFVEFPHESASHAPCSPLRQRAFPIRQPAPPASPPRGSKSMMLERDASTSCRSYVDKPYGLPYPTDAQSLIRCSCYPSGTSIPGDWVASNSRNSFQRAAAIDGVFKERCVVIGLGVSSHNAAASSPLSLWLHLTCSDAIGLASCPSARFLALAGWS